MTDMFNYRIPIDVTRQKEIIDAFVSVYGEERRKEIEKRLSKVQIFVFKSDQEIAKQISDTLGYKSENLREALAKRGIDNSLLKISNKVHKTRKMMYKKFRIGYSPRKTHISSITSKALSKEIRKMKFEAIKKDIEKIKFLYPFADKDLKELMVPGTSWCTSELAQTENGIEVVPIVFVDTSKDPNGVDQIIFHELNHVIETSIKPLFEPEKCERSVGWVSDIVSTRNGRSYTPVSKNEIGFEKNELFSEIMNELIAEQVARNFHAQGHSIVSDPKNAFYDECYYRDVEFLVKDFFNTYHEEIIKSKTGESSELFDKVGRENFEELNELINKYEIMYDKLKKHSFIPGLREGIKYKIGKLKTETIGIKNKILEKMGLHAPTEEKASGMSM